MGRELTVGRGQGFLVDAVALLGGGLLGLPGVGIALGGGDGLARLDGLLGQLLHFCDRVRCRVCLHGPDRERQNQEGGDKTARRSPK